MAEVATRITVTASDADKVLERHRKTWESYTKDAAASQARMNAAMGGSAAAIGAMSQRTERALNSTAALASSMGSLGVISNDAAGAIANYGRGLADVLQFSEHLAKLRPTLAGTGAAAAGASSSVAGVGAAAAGASALMVPAAIAVGALGLAVAGVAPHVNKLEGTMADLDARFAESGVELKARRAAFELTGQAVGTYREALAILTSEEARAVGSLKANREAAAAAAAEWQRQEDALATQATRLRDLENERTGTLRALLAEYDAHVKASREVGEAVSEEVRAQRDAIATELERRDAINRTVQGWETAATAQQAFTRQQEDYRAKLERVLEGEKLSAAGAKAMSEELKRLREAAVQVGTRLDSDLVARLDLVVTSGGEAAKAIRELMNAGNGAGHLEATKASLDSMLKTVEGMKAASQAARRQDVEERVDGNTTIANDLGAKLTQAGTSAAQAFGDGMGLVTSATTAQLATAAASLQRAVAGAVDPRKAVASFVGGLEGSDEEKAARIAQRREEVEGDRANVRHYFKGTKGTRGYLERRGEEVEALREAEADLTGKRLAGREQRERNAERMARAADAGDINNLRRATKEAAAPQVEETRRVTAAIAQSTAVMQKMQTDIASMLGLTAKQTAAADATAKLLAGATGASWLPSVFGARGGVEQRGRATGAISGSAS